MLERNKWVDLEELSLLSIEETMVAMGSSACSIETSHRSAVDGVQKILLVCGPQHLTAHPLCYIRVERSAQLEWRGCDQDVLLSGDEASASGTR